MRASPSPGQADLLHAPVWGALSVGVLLLSALLNFYGLRGSLPYHDDPDEPVLYIAATEIRATGFPKIKPYYPPLRLYEMALEQIVLDTMTGGPAAAEVYVFFSRTVTAYTALLTLAALGLLGRLLHSAFAGFVAMSLLAADIQMVRFSHLSRADPLAWFLMIGVMIGTLRYLRRPAQVTLFWPLACSLLACLAKYSAAPVFLLPLAAGGSRLVRGRAARAALLALLVVGGLGAFAALRLYLRTGAPESVLRPVADLSLGFLFQDHVPLMKNFSTGWRNLAESAGPAWLGVAFVLLPAGALWMRPRLEPARVTLLVLLAATAAATLVLFPLTLIRYWDVYHLVLIGALLGGLALGLAAERWRRWGLIAALAVTAVLGVPKVAAAWQFDQEQTRPRAQAGLGNWFIDHAPQGARTVTEYIKPFSTYAGFPGRLIYHQYVVADRLLPDAGDLEDYRARGYEYLILYNFGRSPDDWAEDVEAAQRLLAAGPVAAFGPPDYVGQDIRVFRLPPLQQYTRYAWFTPAISFRGYDLNRDTFAPGEQVELMLYWMSAEKTPASYTVFVHLLDPDTGRLAAGHDGPPDYGNSPTWAWQGDMQFIRDQRIFTIPPGTPPGTYTLRIGMYDAVSQARVQVLDIHDQPLGDGLVLQDIHVK